MTNHPNRNLTPKQRIVLAKFESGQWQRLGDLGIGDTRSRNTVQALWDKGLLEQRRDGQWIMWRLTYSGEQAFRAL